MGSNKDVLSYQMNSKTNQLKKKKEDWKIRKFPVKKALPLYKILLKLDDLDYYKSCELLEDLISQAKSEGIKEGRGKRLKELLIEEMIDTSTINGEPLSHSIKERGKCEHENACHCGTRHFCPDCGKLVQFPIKERKGK